MAQDKEIKSKVSQAKQTHIYLQNKSLKVLPPARLNPEHLSVIYLYNNNIEKIENLDQCVNLTRLYLQHNKIKLLENLDKLTKLKKLYIGYNQISVIENLEHNIHLEELHAEKQQLKKCDCVCFDPRSIHAISASLHVLNISGNAIKSIYNLTPLSALRILDASKNKIKETDDILNAIQFWYYLYEATFLGNPVAKKHRYRELIIGHTMRLSMLDGKQISPSTRAFIKGFEEEKKLKAQRKVTVNLSDVMPNLPQNYPRPLQEAVSSSIVQTDLTELKQHNYVPWNKLPKRTPKVALVKTAKRK